MCPYCNIALANSDKNNFSLDIFGNELGEMQKISKSVHKTANSYNNLALLHKTCHLAVTLKLDSGELSAERLAR